MSKCNMNVRNLMLRCYANKHNDQWQAFCIDFNLAVQGNSFTEVKRKLAEQVSTYIYDALVGDDKEFAEQLLSRKAPLKQRLTYHAIKLAHHIGLWRNGLHRLFKEPVPLVPQAHVHA